MATSKPLVIGVLGGIASGKSYVSQRFAEQGAVVLDADRAGHQTLAEPTIQNILRRRWGDRVFNDDGTVDRKAVAAIVFAPQGADELTFLEQTTHPRIGERLQQQIDQLADQANGEAPAALVLDAPVMLKAGWDRLCDYLVFVDAPPNVRLARALQRGWTAEEFSRRELTQESTGTKRERADYVIDNGGSEQHTQQQVIDFWRRHVAPSPSPHQP
ncbi:dephospho-CoA kinase [Lignipirellula cremea]|uniref:Dephospho-CoA kinase n=1 Tax=Lignipirellula cremea TaxID=2528010 RepID=A0A518DSH9_9BACT|nr:dephospho-CoA kinase [Lignipirellula cremea]QDU94784.1 Dephospho-CoA kinase [Lignipirellula cremea]